MSFSKAERKKEKNRELKRNIISAVLTVMIIAPVVYFLYVIM